MFYINMEYLKNPTIRDESKSPRINDIERKSGWATTDSVRAGELVYHSRTGKKLTSRRKPVSASPAGFNFLGSQETSPPD